MIYMSELHQHPLAFSDVSYLYISKCHKCDDYCPSNCFICIQCDFYIHAHCFPLLPPATKVNWHRHRLTLTHDRIKDHYDEDDNADFYCDKCEEERDLKHPTYYCAECHLVSHVHCVISEVMDYLQEKWTLVEELGNTKVIVVGENKATGSIFGAIGNKDGVEQGDRDITSDDSNHFLAKINNEIDTLSTELKEHKEQFGTLLAKVEENKKIRATLSLQLKELEERRAQHIASTKLSSSDTST